MAVDIQELIDAGESNYVVEFDYIDREGQQTFGRQGELTEVRGMEEVWMLDYFRGREIRRFKIANMSNLRVLINEETEEPITFEPDFPFVIT